MSPGPSSSIRLLYWFRTDLRLHSSPALHTALSLQPHVVYPIWILDPEYVFAHRVGANRFNFLLESMRDLSDSLTALNPRSKLLVVRGAPKVIIPFLIKEWGISHLVYERDTAGYARIRDHEINQTASEVGVKVVTVLGHTLYDPEETVKLNSGRATTSLASWRAAVKSLPEPPRPLPAPTSFPSPGDITLSTFKLDADLSTGPTIDLNASQRIEKITCYENITGPHGDFGIPSLKELGLSNATTSIRGGQSEALRRLTAYCADGDRVASFSKPKTSPAEFDPPETTLLSPYLKFGCLGIHEFLWRLRDTLAQWHGDEGKAKAKTTSKRPESLEGQLYFREMYYAAEFAQGAHFRQMRGNSICRFVDWDLEDTFDESGLKVVPRPSGDPQAEGWFLAWKEGRTGFPWIDAIMRQLRHEGWIHHLARHSVACFLTRGQCYISWERGAEVFDEFLLDWDPCANPGNWLWLSASAFYSKYYRVYGVKSFPMKYDKTGELIRKFCPELTKFPDEFIYTPHLAPLELQEKAGCIIGQDYPMPMLDAAVEQERCMVRMKAAYSLGLHGSDKQVLDGTAGKLLREAYQEALSRVGNDVEGFKQKRKVGDSNIGDNDDQSDDSRKSGAKEDQGTGDVKDLLRAANSKRRRP